MTKRMKNIPFEEVEKHQTGVSEPTTFLKIEGKEYPVSYDPETDILYMWKAAGQDRYHLTEVPGLVAQLLSYYTYEETYNDLPQGSIVRAETQYGFSIFVKNLEGWVEVGATFSSDGINDLDTYVEFHKFRNIEVIRKGR